MKTASAVVLLVSFIGLAAAHPAPEAHSEPAARAAAVAAAIERREAQLEERGTSVSVVYPEGESVGVSLLGIESFRGVPFAQPPVGNLRLKPPLRYTASVGKRDASGTGPSCPQMYLSTESGSTLLNLLGDFVNIPLFQTVTNAQEDCLTLNVQRPAGTTSSSKLPVLFWIFGGGFELGSNMIYDGVSLITQGVDIGEPFVFVAINYRTGGFGFLGGKEIKADGAANLGLLDQRAALEWVADNIAAFGGDPDRVTIWGESAGSISVFDQMALYGGNITYKGKALFRGGIMDSGSVVPAEPVDGAKAQAIYDQVVAEAGCASASDTLACLRSLPYSAFLNAANSVPGILSYNSLALSYLPRPDGKVLTDSPDILIATKQYAAVPFIIGDQEDEGTLFAIFPNNVTSTSAIVKYLKSLYFHGATEAQLTAFVNTYSTSITAGSPFRTGIFNELYPGFKRLAAILGDMTFTLSRRVFLQAHTVLHPDVPAWSYLSSYDYGTPYLGTLHATDLLQVFYGVLPNYASGAVQTYYINFVTTGDPNKGAAVKMTWPKWSEGQNLLNIFSDKAVLLADTFRQASSDFLANNLLLFHI